MDSTQELETWLEELSRLGDESKMTAKQLNIVRAAVELFSEKGYANASTSEIAQRAGVAEGTIFRHYKTKSDLLFSIITPIMSKFVAPFVLRDFSKVLHTEYASYGDYLRAVLKNRLAFARRHQKVIKIMLQEIPFQPELKEKFQSVIAEKIFSIMETVAVHFQTKGELIKLPAKSVIRLTVSTMIGHVLFRLFIAPDWAWNDEQDIEDTVQFMLHGLAAK